MACKTWFWPGEFMNLTFLINKNHSKFEDKASMFLSKSTFWLVGISLRLIWIGKIVIWNLIAGNLGQTPNWKLQTKKLKSDVLAADFDEKGSHWSISGMLFIVDKSYPPIPSPRRTAKIRWFPMRSKFHKSYAATPKATINSCFLKQRAPIPLKY